MAPKPASEETVDRIMSALARVDDRLRTLEVSVKVLSVKVDNAIADSQAALQRAADTNGRVRGIEETQKHDHVLATAAQASLDKHLAESGPLTDATQTLVALAKAEQARAWVHRRGGMFLRFVVLVAAAAAAVGSIGAGAWHLMKETVIHTLK